MKTASYCFPDRQYSSELSVTKSRFISTLRRIQSLDEMRLFCSELKTAHPKANHNCWAVLAGSPNDSGLYGFSDDGEPKGTAGKPIFNVLQHSGKGQIGVIVTRYFGGIKLGTGGLVRAYTQAAKDVMGVATFIPFTKTITLACSFPYEEEGVFRHILDQHEILQVDFSYTEHVNARLEVAENILESLVSNLKKRLRVSLQIGIV